MVLKRQGNLPMEPVVCKAGQMMLCIEMAALGVSAALLQPARFDLAGDQAGQMMLCTEIEMADDALLQPARFELAGDRMQATTVAWVVSELGLAQRVC